MDFKLRVLEIPLFDVIEKRPRNDLHEGFAAQATETTVSVDEETLQLISDKLDNEIDSVFWDIERYNGGRYREKSKGPGGNRLGDFGEALAYLHYRPSLGLERVVTYRRPRGRPKKGTKYPIPDFFARRDDGETGCLEVKTKEALKFVQLKAKSNRAKLAPCERLIGMRLEALPQLGFDAKTGEEQEQRHKLVVKGQEKPVLFPVGFGVAVAVLVRDGRLGEFAQGNAYRTPRDCKDADRTCWDCLRRADGSDVDAVMVRMNNSPGHLRLAGSSGEGEEWLGAYQRWSHAVWAREVRTTRDANNALLEATDAWLQRVFRVHDGEFPDARARRAIERRVDSFWSDYMAGCLIPRGLERARPERWRPAADGRIVREDESWLGESDEPVAIEGLLEVLAREARERHDDYRYSVAQEDRQNRNRARYSVTRQGNVLDLRLCSQTWLARGTVDDAAAARLASDALALAGRFFGVDVNEDGRLPVRQITLPGQRRDRSVLGWLLDRTQPGLRELVTPTALERLPRAWQGLLLGVSGFVHVFPDGRARVRLIDQAR